MLTVVSVQVEALNVCKNLQVKEKFKCYEAQIEESEKASSRRESNPGHLACAALRQEF